jgi:Trk K+ transport system NAD-binding subunit
VVCGYGRFGRAIDKKFREFGIPVTFIEVNPPQRGAPVGTILGVGTEEETLRKADIENATGIVAGTPDDADNLSIIITARNIQPDIITVARQNLSANKPMFRAALVNLIMEPVRIIADEIFIRISTPLLMDFLELLKQEEDQWGRELLLRISAVVEDQPLDAWAYTVNQKDCPAIHDSLARGKVVILDNLCRDPRKREDELPAFPLLLKRGEERILLPDPTLELQADDEILIAGQHGARLFMNWVTYDYNVLRYIRTGIEAPGGWLWQWVSSVRKKRRRRRAAKSVDPK